MAHINSFSMSGDKKSFVNKFSNMELYYKTHDDKKNSFTQEPIISPMARNTIMGESKNFAMQRKSRKSIIFSPPPRKSFMYDSKAEIFSNANEKNKNILKTIDLNKYTPDQLLDLTVTVLQKPSNYRSPSDIKILVKATENIKFFQEISQEKGPEFHEQICRYMTHKYLSSGDIVFHEGTIGTTFYIILKGSVSVMKMESTSPIANNNNNNNVNNHSGSPNSPDKLRFSKKSETIIINQLGGLKRTESFAQDIKGFEKKSNFLNESIQSPAKKSALLLNRTESLVPDINIKGMEKKNFLSNETIQSPGKKSISPEKTSIEVRVLEIGDSFGELALIENKPRAATIKCKENCHFAVLDKQFFVHILKENEQKKLFQHIDFFSNLLLFKQWTYNEVKNLKLHSEIIELKRNKFVYKEGDPADYFYIVRSGEFKLLKELSILTDQELMEKKMRLSQIPKFNSPKLAKKSMFDVF